MKKTFFAAMVLAVAGTVWAASPWRVPVHFEHTDDAGVGYSWFVVGSHPDLGAWDALKAVPLAWHEGNVWSADIGIQAGTELQYKFIKRPTDAANFPDSGNTYWWPEAEDGNDHNLSLSVPAEPEAPYPGKKIVFLCDWPEPVLLHYAMLASPDPESVVGEWLDAPMTKTGDGRYEVEGIGEAGEWIRFVFFHPLDDKPDGEKWWYHFRPADDVEEDSFWTPLDAFCVRDGQVFNYEPKGYVSNSRIVEREVGSGYPSIAGRTIRVYLPRGYDENTSRRYPVLYFADGQNIFSDQHSSSVAWGVDLAADREIRAGRMREAILVGVPCRTEPIPGTTERELAYARLWEYLPGTDYLMGSPQLLGRELWGLGTDYADFLIHNVRPTIDYNVCEDRTLNDRANTGHVGSSAGGLLSLFLGTYTNVFGLVGAVSGVYNQEYIPNFRNWCYSHRTEIGTNAIKRIWLDTGTEETSVGDGQLALNLYESNWEALTLLLYAGHIQNKTLHFGVYSGDYGQHNEFAWAARAPDILDFLLPVTDEANPLLPLAVSLDVDGTEGTFTFPAYGSTAYSLRRADDICNPENAETVWQAEGKTEKPWGTTNQVKLPLTGAAGFYWVEGE